MMKMTESSILDSIYQLTKDSHKLEFKSRKLKGIKLINSTSWASFTLTFLKKGKEISFNARGVTKRFNPSDVKDIQNILRGFEVI